MIASNDLIGDFNIDITPLVEDVYHTDKVATMSKTYWNSYMRKNIIDRELMKEEDVDKVKFEDMELFWVPVSRYNEETDEMIPAGKIQCSFRIYPLHEADKNN